MSSPFEALKNWNPAGEESSSGSSAAPEKKEGKTISYAEKGVQHTHTYHSLQFNKVWNSLDDKIKEEIKSHYKKLDELAEQQSKDSTENYEQNRQVDAELAALTKLLDLHVEAKSTESKNTALPERENPSESTVEKEEVAEVEPDLENLTDDEFVITEKTCEHLMRSAVQMFRDVYQIRTKLGFSGEGENAHRERMTGKVKGNFPFQMAMHAFRKHYRVVASKYAKGESISDTDLINLEGTYNNLVKLHALVRQVGIDNEIIEDKGEEVNEKESETDTAVERSESEVEKNIKQKDELSSVETDVKEIKRRKRILAREEKQQDNSRHVAPEDWVEDRIKNSYKPKENIDEQSGDVSNESQDLGTEESLETNVKFDYKPEEYNLNKQYQDAKVTVNYDQEKIPETLKEKYSPQSDDSKDENTPKDLSKHFEDELNDKQENSVNNKSESYQAARQRWLAAREMLGIKTRDEQGNEQWQSGLGKEFSSKYKAHIKSLESKWWKPSGAGQHLRRMLGLQPKLTPELISLQEKLNRAKAEYFASSQELRRSKDLSTETYGDKEQLDKVLARYQRLLAHKLVVNPAQERIKIQEEAVGEAWNNSRLKSVSQWLQKHRTARIITTTVGYAAVGAAGGGLVVGASAGAGYLARWGLGTAAGSFVGLSTAAVGEMFFTSNKEKRLIESEQDLKSNFLNVAFNKSEADFNKIINATQSTKQRVETAAKISALAAGGLVAGSTTNLDNNLPPESAPIVEDPKPIKETLPEDFIPKEETILEEEGLHEPEDEYALDEDFVEQRYSYPPISVEGYRIPEGLILNAANPEPKFVDGQWVVEIDSYRANGAVELWNMAEGNTKAPILETLEHIPTVHHEALIKEAQAYVGAHPRVADAMGFPSLDVTGSNTHMVINATMLNELVYHLAMRRNLIVN